MSWAPKDSNKCNIFCFDMAELAGAGTPPLWGRGRTGLVRTPATVDQLYKNSRVGSWSQIPAAQVAAGDLITDGFHIGVVVGWGKTAHFSGSRSQVVVEKHFGWYSKKGQVLRVDTGFKIIRYQP
jgi:hypothetical protein